MTPLNKIECFLLDMDGTIYLGDKLIDGANDFLVTIKRLGKRYIFITNNSSKNRNVYVQKLNRMGIEAQFDDVFTSGEAATITLNKIKPGARVFLLGTNALKDEFKSAGFKTVTKRGDPDFVVLGFDTTLTYDKLWAACDFIRAGVPYYATHPDLNCPIEGGRHMPDTGSMIAFIKAATGRSPVVIGKPNRYITDAIMEKYRLTTATTAIVGDRLYTDIKTGLNTGMTAILVLTGETGRAMAARSAVKSDYVFDSVKDMIPLLS